MGKSDRLGVVPAALAVMVVTSPSQARAQTPTDRGTGHRFRPFIAAGSAGLNGGIEGEYSLTPYLSLLGWAQGWYEPSGYLCPDVGRSCRTLDGWGLGPGLRVSAVGPLPWWLFLQGGVGLYYFANSRSGPIPTFDGRAGIVARVVGGIEVELGVKYQRVGEQRTSATTFPAENWGALLFGVGFPVG